jgi:molybdate transport system substrate-binding protein
MQRTTTMMMRHVRWTVVALVLLRAVAAGAAEIKVLTAGALKPVVMAFAPDVERDTGHRVRVETDTAGALARRVREGEAFDLLIVTSAIADELTAAGKVEPGSALPLARVGIGVAVKQGAPLPDLADVDSFRKALLDARAVAYIDPRAGGSSGIYLSRLFERLGIAADIGRKAVLVPGGLVGQRLLSGEADLALQQMSELLVVPGISVVGPVPAAVQNYTVYAGVIASAAANAAGAKAFLATLGGPGARSLLKTKGMESP